MHTAHVPAGDGPFPTILALHGWGASAHDLLGLAPYLQGGEALVLCPQGPVAFETGPGQRGHGWFPISSGTPMDPVAFVRGRGVLAAWLDEATSRYPIDRKNLAVLGFSQGGVMAFDLVLRAPERFAGLAALSTWLPDDLANAIPASDALTSFPVLVQHGTKDPMIPLERAIETRDRLARLHVDLSYREYEMEHAISPESLRDLVAWLDEKVLRPIRLA